MAREKTQSNSICYVLSHCYDMKRQGSCLLVDYVRPGLGRRTDAPYSSCVAIIAYLSFSCEQTYCSWISARTTKSNDAFLILRAEDIEGSDQPQSVDKSHNRNKIHWNCHISHCHSPPKSAALQCTSRAIVIHVGEVQISHIGIWHLPVTRHLLVSIHATSTLDDAHQSAAGMNT
jgi:hypothetical protein